MKHVLLLNFHQKYEGFANGNLTHALLEEAKSFFLDNGYEIRESAVDYDYDVSDELDKFQWADIFFIQTPVYWMGIPWKAKKYIDEVFSGGNSTVTFMNDGRSRDDVTKKYGSGGLMTQKQYMISLTYNCPISEFDNPGGFFDGLTLDEANVALHKTFQFCGAKPLETYSVHDVYKSDFNLDDALENLRKKLEKNFKE